VVLQIAGVIIGSYFIFITMTTDSPAVNSWATVSDENRRVAPHFVRPRIQS